MDYSYIELVTLAAVCQARFGYSKLADIIRAGVDPHCHTAAMLLGVSLEEFMSWKVSDIDHYKLSRQRAKGVNFGVPGGMGPPGLVACVLLGAHQPEHQADELPRWRETFGDRCYALAELHRGPHDDWLLQRFQDLAQHARLPLVAGNGVLYHVAERRYLHDVLTATRLGVTVAELGEHRQTNGERHLKSAEAMRALFAACPAAVERTLEVANCCSFSLDELKYEYPEELCPRGETPLAWLTQLTWAGSRERYPHGLPGKVRQLIEHELALITDLHYEAYFLTVWDLVRFARSRGIFCQGRGSAANSAVCFCLGVTSVDPDRIDVLCRTRTPLPHRGPRSSAAASLDGEGDHVHDARR